MCIRDSSYTDRVIVLFVPNFDAMAMGVDRGKWDLQHSIAHPRKPFYRRKKYCRYLLRKTSYNRFCLKFRCHGNRGRSGKNAIGSIRCPIPENSPNRRKNLAKISYASRVIVNFVTNFVTVATGIDQGKLQLAAFDGPSPKTPYRHQKISYASRVIANFVPNFFAMATKESPK